MKPVQLGLFFFYSIFQLIKHMISLIQNIITTLDHIILLLLKNDFVCIPIHFSKMLWQYWQLPKTIVHWSGCRSDDTHTEPADNSYQLQNWIFLSSPSPDEYSSTEPDNVASTLTPFYAPYMLV